MRFPARTSTHIAETASWGIVSALLPPEWIPRHATERDYGIDCLLELVWQRDDKADGFLVTGDLCSLQLKGQSTIVWEPDGSEWGNRSWISGIPKSTINYWFHLPVPVFLVVADLDTKQAYFASVKEQVRRQYAAYSDDSQATMGFELRSRLRLEAPEGHLLLFASYVKELRFGRFSENLVDLIVHEESYRQFLEYKQGCDEFMEMDPQDVLTLVRIYEVCRGLSDALGFKWQIDSLEQIEADGVARFGESHSCFRYDAVERLGPALRARFEALLSAAADLITKQQHDYWSRTSPLLRSVCSRMSLP